MPVTIPATLPAEVLWTPTWTGLTPGSGTNQGRYWLEGKRVTFWVEFIFGSGSSLSNPNYFNWPLPAAYIPKISNFNLQILDSGTASFRGAVEPTTMTTTRIGDLCVITANATYATLANISSTVPMTWATNDRLVVSGWYTAA